MAENFQINSALPQHNFPFSYDAKSVNIMYDLYILSNYKIQQHYQ